MGNRWLLALGSFLILSLAFIVSPTAHAATAPGTATWVDKNTITYSGVTYKGETKKVLDTAVAQAEFRAYLPASGPGVIFFDQSTNIATTKTAFYTTTGSSESSKSFTLNFSNTQSAVTASAPAPTDGTTNTDGENADGCKVDGIGWIICPVSTFLAKVNDGAYALAENFLVFRVSENPFSTDPKVNPIYTIWSNIRNIANVSFVVAMFIVIFSQATSIGLSNYGIKKMLPRMIVAAILVNLSYYICLFAIDISNIIGAGIDGIMRAPLAGLPTNSDGTWEEITAGILAGVIGTTALAVAVIVAAGPLFAFLAAAALAIFTALVVLIARQAFLVILIVLAPLAFVAYILPNTESLFDKWRKAFIAMLVMYPMFAVIFAGAEVAATIIRNAEPAASGSWLTPVVALGVQTIPLFALPFIVKFSGGVIGRVAGIVNDRNKGLIDRSRKIGDRRSMANKANLVQNKWGKNEDGTDKGGATAKWKRRVGTGAGFVGGYQARKEFKENSIKADSERIQQGDIASRLQDENNSLARRSTLRGETGREVARARGIAIEDKLIGEEASAAKTVIENLGLDEKQKSQLSVTGRATGADGKAILSGDFYQKAMHSQYAAQGRIGELQKAVEASDTMSDEVRGTLAYYLDQNFSTLKAKGHHLNSDVIKNKLRTKKIGADGSVNNVKITAADNQAAAAQMTAGLSAEYLATQDPKSLEYLQQAINSGSLDATTAGKVRSALQTALDNPSTKAKFTTDTRALAQSIVDTGKPVVQPPPVTEWNSGQPVVIPQPQTVTATIPRENIQTMSRVEIERIIEPVPGRGVDTLSDADIAKLINATRDRTDIADIHTRLSEERNRRRGGFDPGAGPSGPLP